MKKLWNDFLVSDFLEKVVAILMYVGFFAFGAAVVWVILSLLFG